MHCGEGVVAHPSPPRPLAALLSAPVCLVRPRVHSFRLESAFKQTVCIFKLLEQSWLTKLCGFQVYSKMNQLYVCIYPLL